MQNGKNVLNATERASFQGQVGKKPYIPKGYNYLKGRETTGFVIKSESDGSEFTWVPVEMLEANGTLDGKNFNSKYGRRRFYKQVAHEGVAEEGIHEEIDSEVLKSIEEFGGIYIARHTASRLNDRAVFISNAKPWTEIEFTEAEKVAEEYAKDSEELVSCILSGAAFDSVIQFGLQADAITKDDVEKDSTYLGNYSNSPYNSDEILPTGSNEEWSFCHIYDLCGNVDEYTTEQYGKSWRIIRGGNYKSTGNYWPIGKRFCSDTETKFRYTSFRIMLYKKPTQK